MHVKRDVLLEVFQSQHCLGFSASLKALNSECVTKKKKIGTLLHFFGAFRSGSLHQPVFLGFLGLDQRQTKPLFHHVVHWTRRM